MLGWALQMWLWLMQPPGPGLAFDAYTSAGADPAEPLPTVVVLHGRDDALHGLPKALRASKRPLRVVVPKGPRKQRDGTHAWFRRSDVRSGRADEVAVAADAVARLLEELQEAGVVRGRPILVGYSQGAMVALEVSLRAPNSVGEVLAIGGHLPPSHVPKTLVPHAVTHVLVGERDRVMRADVSRSQVRRLQALGYVVDARAFPGQGHGMGPQMRRAALKTIHAALKAQARS